MWLYRVNRAVAPLLGAYWRLGLTGDLSTLPRQGPLLVAANHTSFLDPWLIGMVFPRPVRYLIVRRWYERSPLWRAVFRSFGTIPVETGDSEATFASILAALRCGEAVGIFPEGHLSPDGRLQRFRSGIARVAARSGAPVLPVGIRGGFRTLSRDRRVPRPTKVTVHVGRPIVFAPQSRAGEPTTAEVQAFLTTLASAVRDLTGERPVPSDLAGVPVKSEATGGAAGARRR